MGSICAEQHNFHSPHQLFLSKKTQRAIDIPPRKYLTRRPSFTSLSPENSDFTLLQKFLPYNNTVDDDDTDPYTLDEFRMYQFKIRKCTRSRSHDWTDCPFVHPGEKARRRDPRRFNYSGTACTEFRRGGCSRGDECEYAHGVFECWLHPTRYRTEACKDGKNCKRKVCFFAHTPRQLRLMPLNSNGCVCYHHSVTASPTSTLSPPLSPAKPQSMSSGFSPISRFGDRLSYKDKVIELMSSLEAMNVSEAVNNCVPSWADEQQQFILSPTLPSPSTSGQFFTGNDDDNGLAGPDLGWVNDLLK